MYSLRKTFRFEASHQLVHHDGKCARLHGHSWVLHVECRGEALHVYGPKDGMLMDFGDISMVVKPIIERQLDHYHLNESTPFADSPTSENLARWLFEQLYPMLPYLHAVTIEETCTSGCRYTRR